MHFNFNMILIKINVEMKSVSALPDMIKLQLPFLN